MTDPDPANIVALRVARIAAILRRPVRPVQEYGIMPPVETTVPAWIPPEPRVALVGQSPGRVEGRTGIPFTGPAGTVLRRWLGQVGLNPETDCLFTNVCSTFYPNDLNHIPTAAEAEAGAHTVLGELAIAPTLKVVVLLGAAAASAMAPWASGAMGKLQGRQVEVSHLPAFISYHPSYWLRIVKPQVRAEVEGAILDVLMRAAAVARGEPEGVALPEPEYVEEVVIQ